MGQPNDSDGKDTPAGRIERFLQAFKSRDPDTKHFDETLVNPLKIVSASVPASDPMRAFATFSYKVPESACNTTGNLHGGAVATIFDYTTSFAIYPIMRDGFWDEGHVSRTLNVTYLRPAPEGEELLIENEVVSLGRSMACVKGIMRRKKDGKICYICEHNKVNTGSKL